MTPYRFHHTSEGPLVPPLPGYQHSLTSNIRIEPGIATAGLYITRVQIDHFKLTISTVLGHTPTDYAAYIRLLSVQWIDTTGKTTNPGLAVEGDPFSPNSHNGSGKILRRYNPGEEPALEKCGLVIETILKSFDKFGASNGNRVNRKMISRFFDEGLMDLVVREALKGFSTTVLKACDPDSIESVPNLDYEIGLGICYEAEPIGLPQAVPIAGPPKGLEPKVSDLRSNLLENSEGFHELSKVVMLKDVQEAIRMSRVITPGLVYPTSRLLATWPEVRYHVGGNTGSTYVTGDWYDPVPEFTDEEHELYVIRPPCMFRLGDPGTYWFWENELVHTIRSQGTCIYGDPWLAKKLKPALQRLSVEDLFPNDIGKSASFFEEVTTLKYG